MGRFLVADLKEPHHVLSTSVRNGGLLEHVRWLVNHQSCRGLPTRPSQYDHRQLASMTTTIACAKRLGAGRGTAVMGTAANMNYVAVVQRGRRRRHVTAAVTAGVEGNATAAGEPATWRETDAGMHKVPVYAGTIHTLLFISRPLTAAACARRRDDDGRQSAALHRLAVPSKLHVDLATGTGTDQYRLAAPLGGGKPLTSASPHVKLGELVGSATRQATMEALRWQNGLEASYTRGVFHALGRYGVREATIFEDIAPFLNEGDLELLKKNSKAVFYEPLVGAAAHALATVCDRVRYGTLPDGVAPDAMVQQAASLAANLAAQMHRWPEFRATLRPHATGDVKTLVLRAVALGWSEKWRTGD